MSMDTNEDALALLFGKAGQSIEEDAGDCGDHDPEEQEEARENSELFAVAEELRPLWEAAPDLLAALALMTKWADRLGTIAANCGAIDRTMALDADIDTARAALRKARGE